MEFKLNERSQKLVQKLHKEGLLDTFLQSLQKTLKKQNDAQFKKYQSKMKDKEQELIRQIKADPEKVLQSLIKPVK
tara:strand:+ start:197 stop:424 length:228 start_codon:yes stop_codon:yes gene_type:complete